MNNFYLFFTFGTKQIIWTLPKIARKITGLPLRDILQYFFSITTLQWERSWLLEWECGGWLERLLRNLRKLLLFNPWKVLGAWFWQFIHFVCGFPIACGYNNNKPSPSHHHRYLVCLPFPVLGGFWHCYTYSRVLLQIFFSNHERFIAAQILTRSRWTRIASFAASMDAPVIRWGACRLCC